MFLFYVIWVATPVLCVVTFADTSIVLSAYNIYPFVITIFFFFL